ncbi:MAG: hypothetical protein JST20_13725 [Bacteroidetes bacterium]|nr:hypothetical protein [Bacteroidota bacterium]
MLVFFLLHSWLGFSIDIFNPIHRIIIIGFFVNIFHVFRRVVISIHFDESTKQFLVVYYQYFFQKRTVTVHYSTAGYLAYNTRTLSLFKNTPQSNELTNLHFYNGRKYIAKIVVSSGAWESNQLEEMVKLLIPFAHEYKMSPGMF